MPSFKTIYRWIDERYLKSTLKNLRRKGKIRKRLGNGGRFTTDKSIRKRDKAYIRLNKNAFNRLIDRFLF